MFLYASGSDHTCAPDAHGFSVAGVFLLWGQLVKRVGDRCELLVGRIEEFWSFKRREKGGVKGRKWMGTCMSKLTMTGHWSGRGYSRVCKVGEGRGMREKKASVLEVAVDNAMVVETIDGIGDGADDGDRVVLCKLPFARTRSNNSLPVASSKER